MLTMISTTYHELPYFKHLFLIGTSMTYMDILGRLGQTKLNCNLLKSPCTINPCMGPIIHPFIIKLHTSLCMKIDLYSYDNEFIYTFLNSFSVFFLHPQVCSPIFDESFTIFPDVVPVLQKSSDCLLKLSHLDATLCTFEGDSLLCLLMVYIKLVLLGVFTFKLITLYY